jgi:putative flippase GtrA
VLYDENARVICQKCVTATQVRTGHAKSAATAKSVAYSNIVIGLVSFVWNPFFTFSIGAIGNAVFVFRRIRDDQRHGEAIPDALGRKIAVTIGAILGALALALDVLLRAIAARSAGP